MGRRGGMLSRALAREVSRSIRQSAREAAQRQRMQVKAAKEHTKFARLQYVEQRAREAEVLTEGLNAQIDELKSLLSHTLPVDDTVSFNSLRLKEQYPQFSLPPDLATSNTKPNDVATYLAAVKEPGWFAR